VEIDLRSHCTTGRFFDRTACFAKQAGISSRPFKILLSCLALALVLLIPSPGASSDDLVTLRQQNASLVLTKYRAKPLAAANGNQVAVTVADCIRLAIQNNLDIQTQIWDEQVRRSFAKSDRLRMLPRIEGRYDLTQRDLHAFSRSDVLGAEGAFEVIGPTPGSGVNNFSTGRERFARNGNAQLKWSPMDAAMARYTWRIKCNEATYARYQRVRVAQQLVGTVGSAFYRLLALVECLPKAKALVGNRQKIAADLKALAKRQLVKGDEYLVAAASVAEAKDQLSDIHVEIGRQRQILASSMHVSPDSCMRLVGKVLPPPAPAPDPCKLEAAALLNRPEVYQADLTFLTSIDEQKRLAAKCFPRFEGFVGYFQDGNKFLLSNNWIDGGMRVTWDLQTFTSDLLLRKAAAGKIAKSETERSLISMGILSQVRQRHLDSVRAVIQAKKFNELMSNAAENLKTARERESITERGAPRRIVQITRQIAMCDLLQAEVDHLMAVGEIHAALSNLQAAVGTNYPVAEAHPPETGPDPFTAVLTPVSQFLAPVAQAAAKPFEYLDKAVESARSALPH
jgi:outer membrane protein TolC